MKPLKWWNALDNSLFKNILFSFFPKNLQIWWWKAAWLEPASLFISFISARQFFSVVNRKVLENFKLNMFDISIDPFDAKIWFGDTPSIKVKELDNYYSYCSVANMNGYKHFNPWLMWISLATMFVANLPDIFENNEKDNIYFSQFALTTYIMSFVMYARIKVFPYTDKKKNFNRFIELYFGLYESLLQRMWTKYTKKRLTEIKKEVVKEVWLFFALFYSYQRINKALETDFLPMTEFYNWLFYHELRDSKYKELLTDFIDNSKKTNKLSTFSTTEKYIIDTVCPADFFVRYIMNKKEIFVSSRTVCSSIYNNETIHNYFRSFLKDDSKREEFFKHINSQKILKNNFFDGVKDYIFKKYKTNTDYDYDEERELDDFFSAVWDIESVDDMESLPNKKIPKKIKQEAGSMELFINYYINILWWMWVARWDWWFVRLFRKWILEDLLNEHNVFDQEQESLYYYGGLLYLYTKNVFYYKYAYDSVKSWKWFFQLPFRSNIKEVHSNLYLIHLFNENAISTLLQDFTDFEVKIYIQNKKILGLFTKTFGKTISPIMHLSRKEIIKETYHLLDTICWKNIPLLETLQKHITDKDIHNLKLRFYSFDFWLIQKVYKSLIDNGRRNKRGIKGKKDGEKTESISEWNFATLWKLAILKETLFGFFLYITYIIRKWIKEDQLQAIFDIYIKEILMIQTESHLFFKLFMDLIWKFKDILVYRTKLDNNETFLSYGFENWTSFWIANKGKDIVWKLRWEDLLRFRWYLKNISYYNKRFVIPKI